MAEKTKESAARYHKKTLLDAADRLLMQYGYDGMNMNMLAKEAGYSKATVYVYLSGKDEIVRLLSIERLKLLRREFGVILGNAAPLDEKLLAVRSVLDEFAAVDPTYFDFIASSTFAPPNSAATESERELSALIADILTALSALLPAPELKRRWYEYYGARKTAKMFDGEGDR